MSNLEDAETNKSTNRTVLVVYYLLMSFSGCVVGVFLYLALGMDVIIWHAALFVLLHIAWAVLDIKLGYTTGKQFVPHYYVFIIVYLFPEILILWQIHVYSIMLLYMLFPLLLLFHSHASKYILYAGVSSALLIATVIVVSNQIDLVQVEDVNRTFVTYLNAFIATAATVFATLFVYSYSKNFKRIDDKVLLADDENKAQGADHVHLKALYGNVMDYFEKKQPYSQPNYRLAMLAADLHTNTKYLSLAINTFYGGTFESLLNKYRLELVKEMLDKRLAEKYTMEYIYTLAGYSSRTTFYENFRKAFGMSPSDYAELQKSKTLLSEKQIS
jgi:AraC-like DNA-binding protein